MFIHSITKSTANNLYLYTLSDVCCGRNLDVHTLHNEDACIEYIKSIFDTTDYDIKHGYTVNLLSKLRPLYTSKTQKPDITVYKDVIEVDSSQRGNYQSTIQQAVNIVRLLRNIDTKFSTYSVFVFPKLDQKPVIKVTVTFSKFLFRYSLQPLKTIPAVMNEVVCKNLRSSPIITDEYSPRISEKCLIRLSEMELRTFGTAAKQLKSETALVVDSNTEIFKFPAFPVNDTLSVLMNEATNSSTST